MCFEFSKSNAVIGRVSEKTSMRNHPSIEREKTIRARQDPPQWGALYIPGQLATREEAPEGSRPSRVQSSWLEREVHLMSAPEVYAYLLGSWLGCFVDLHEGRMLHPEPSPGFLAGGPFAEQMYMGSHTGTICAAERLGLLKYHPLVKGDRGWIAFPLLADLLFFGRDNVGVYAVNWCIKNEPKDFLQAFKGNGSMVSCKSDEAHQARLLIEDEVFKEAKIRTIHIALSDIPKALRENLRFLYTFLSRDKSLPEPLTKEFTDTIRQRIPKEVPLNETVRAFANRHGGAFHDYVVVLYQAIWRMEIECDLSRPVQIDLPLKPMNKNIKKIFDIWTQREIA